MTRLLPLTAGLLLLLPSYLGAAQPDGNPLTLDEVIADAVSGSASVRAAAATADAANEQRAAARGPWFPRLSLSESWQRGNQPTFVFSSLLASRRFSADDFAIDRLIHPEPLGYARAAATVEQVLFDGGARRAAVDVARSRSDLAGFDVRDAALTAMTSATELYGRLLATQATRRAATAAIESGREDLARAERRRDAGMATDADVLALTVHVADMEQRAIKADGDGAVLRAQINRLTRATIVRTFVAVEPALPADDIADPDALFREAEAGRPDVQKALAAQRLADAGRRAARAALMPTLGLQATIDTSGTRVDDRSSSWIAGGELRWTIGSGGSERAQIRAAAAQQSRARIEVEDARAAARVDVVTATAQLRSARSRQAVGRAAVAQARESERIIRDRYDAGLLPVNDVLRAATAVLDAENQHVSAIADELTSRAALSRALGRVPGLP